MKLWLALGSSPSNSSGHSVTFKTVSFAKDGIQPVLIGCAFETFRLARLLINLQLITSLEQVWVLCGIQEIQSVHPRMGSNQLLVKSQFTARSSTWLVARSSNMLLLMNADIRLLLEMSNLIRLCSSRSVFNLLVFNSEFWIDTSLLGSCLIISVLSCGIPYSSLPSSITLFNQDISCIACTGSCFRFIPIRSSSINTVINCFIHPYLGVDVSSASDGTRIFCKLLRNSVVRSTLARQ